MPSHMSVQKIATKRNALAEMLIDYILQQFSHEMHSKGYVSELPIPEQQKSFIRDDCSEVYDHYLELKLSSKLDNSCRTMQIWAQTTCYKGNATGKPESNKTYEIRETLTEALTLRKWLNEENTFFRTIHFTLGPSEYTYGWFMYAKENAFDLSLYPKLSSSEDLFDLITEIGNDCIYEFDFYERLDKICEDPDHPLTVYINTTVNSLINYFLTGYPISAMANEQSSLLHEIRIETANNMDYVIELSRNSGMDIKGKTISLLNGADIVDPVLGRTLKRIVNTNPFLPIALDAINDWETWSVDAFKIPNEGFSLRDYIMYLWQIESDNRYIIHRLLLRIYTTDSINYIQDINVSGVDEHNLYNGIHNKEQVSEICEYLLEKYSVENILSASDLYNRLISRQARSLVNDSLKFEQINGTSLKPSFFYLEEYIKPTYELVGFETAHLSAPIAYYAKFAEDLNVRAYDNLKVIRNSETKQNLAVVKGKFFRQPEFPRRVKEEAYVGLTAKYNLEEGHFSEKYSNLPFIMFIDMATNYTPPESSLRRIMNYGWQPFFQLNRLVEYLKKLEDRHE